MKSTDEGNSQKQIRTERKILVLSVSLSYFDLTGPAKMRIGQKVFMAKMEFLR